ncbi:hypothetical protein HNP37_000087 [Flavobacterium nitrogenifigens]|uniref:Uncharacterized protein n=2 Tax=Flavobacterium TaxID=237 RepID=A0A7W7IT33_9FLAO|nr:MULTISPECIES: hypothetical protein [Flavobacterium]MBB4800048.1 hypothetical protein [Flavobacterium nitrogenifigens]MBB6386202.1 hypothetical protein [Flavobacterium notoginsengisoli]
MKKNILLLLLLIGTYSFSQNLNKEKRSQAEIKTFILAETKEGGKLDFFTKIKGKEYNGLQVKPGLIMTNLEIALYSWGKANSELGIENSESALLIFQEFKGKELNLREKDLIPMGFRNDLK